MLICDLCTLLQNLKGKIFYDFISVLRDICLNIMDGFFSKVVCFCSLLLFSYSTKLDAVTWKKSKRQSPFGLYESCRKIQFSLALVSGLGKLVCFLGRMGLRMKLIAKKELILLFQMALSCILCDQYFWSYDFLNLF